MKVPHPSPWHDVKAGQIICGKCYDRTRVRMKHIQAAALKTQTERQREPDDLGPRPQHGGRNSRTASAPEGSGVEGHGVSGSSGHHPHHPHDQRSQSSGTTADVGPQAQGTSVGSLPASVLDNAHARRSQRDPTEKRRDNETDDEGVGVSGSSGRHPRDLCATRP